MHIQDKLHPNPSKTASFVPILGRIAYIVSHSYPYSSNGYAVRTHGIARALVEHGHSVIAINRPGRPWDIPGYSDNGLPAQVEIDGVRYIFLRQPSVRGISQEEYLDQAQSTLKDALLVFKPVAVLAASNWKNALPAGAAARELCLPFFYEVRGFWEISRASREPGWENTEAYQKDKQMESHVARSADRVFTLNKFMKQELISRGVQEERIDIVPNGYGDLPDLSRPPKLSKKDLGITSQYVVGYVGSFSEYEGLEDLIKACALVRKQGLDVSLLLVGSSNPFGAMGESVHCSKSAEFKKLARELGFEPYLKLPGRFSPGEVQDYYSLIDLVVIPRRPLPVCELVPPMKAAEALAYGKRLVVSDVEPLAEYAQQYDGVVSFEAGKAASLTQALQKSLKLTVPKLSTGLLFRENVLPMVKALMGENGENACTKEKCIQVVRKPAERKLIKPSIEDVIRNANRLRQADRSKEEFELLKKAAVNDESPKILKSLFWASVRAKEFDFGEQIFERIKEDLRGINGANEWIAKARQTLLNRPVVAKQLEMMLSTRAHRAYAPIRNRICYVLHNSLPYSSGGYATRAHGIATGLRNGGMQPICITRPGFPYDLTGCSVDDAPPVQDIEGISYHTIRNPDRKEFKGHGYIVESAKALREKLEELQPDVVMAASNHLTALPAQIAAYKLGIPFIYEVRGFWEITRISRDPDFLHTDTYAELVRLEALTARKADHVFTLTEAMREELIARGVAGERISLLPNSADPQQFRPRPRDHEIAARLGIPDGTPVIGYIGSFVQYEGLENLAQACAILAERGQDFRLLLVGNENVSGNDRGPITAEIIRIAEEEGLAGKLIMPGRIPHEEVAAYYSLIDIAPFPRKPQPVTEMVSPMKPLEAFAMEKVVVVSSVRALTEMVKHEETGLIFEKGNVQALADTLGRLIGDPALRMRLGKSGRQWVEAKRTWDKTAARVCSMINSIAGEVGSSVRTPRRSP